jgi:ketosteroid isomerase-like protein
MNRILVIAVLVITGSSLALGQTISKKRNQKVEKLSSLNHKFGEAQLERDTMALDRTLADDFTLINPAGRLLNKAQYIADIKSGDLRYESLNYDDVKVQVYRGVAVVIGRVTRRGQYKGQDNSGQFRFTHVFVKHQGGWQLVVAQATRIAQQ